MRVHVCAHVLNLVMRVASIRAATVSKLPCSMASNNTSEGFPVKFFLLPMRNKLVDTAGGRRRSGGGERRRRGGGGCLLNNFSVFFGYTSHDMRMLLLLRALYIII